MTTFRKASPTKLIGENFDYEWSYKSLIRKLNFLEKSTRPDIAYAARFMSDPKKSHGEAVKRIGRYLLGTRSKGIQLKPDKAKGFECYVDANFCGDWDQAIAPEDPDTAKSRHGFTLKLYGMPLYWSSKLQTVMAFSTAESEYIGLSAATRYTLGTIYLMEEINQKYCEIDTVPVFKCKIFEDNTAAVEMARVPKMRPRTRHINVAYHHFRSALARGILDVKHISTELMQADILTKAVDATLLERHRMAIQGW
jgi:hypothetical protein